MSIDNHHRVILWCNNLIPFSKVWIEEKMFFFHYKKWIVVFIQIICSQFDSFVFCLSYDKFSEIQASIYMWNIHDDRPDIPNCLLQIKQNTNVLIINDMKRRTLTVIAQLLTAMTITGRFLNAVQRLRHGDSFIASSSEIITKRLRRYQVKLGSQQWVFPPWFLTLLNIQQKNQ